MKISSSEAKLSSSMALSVAEASAVPPPPSKPPDPSLTSPLPSDPPSPPVPPDPPPLGLPHSSFVSASILLFASAPRRLPPTEVTFSLSWPRRVSVSQPLWVIAFGGGGLERAGNPFALVSLCCSRFSLCSAHLLRCRHHTSQIRRRRSPFPACEPPWSDMVSKLGVYASTSPSLYLLACSRFLSPVLLTSGPQLLTVIPHLLPPSTVSWICSWLVWNRLTMRLLCLSLLIPRCSISAPPDTPYVCHCGIYIAMLRSFTAVCGTLTAVCGSLTMFSPLFGDMVVVSLIWWQLKEVIIFMFPSVIMVLSGIQYPSISLVERFIIPSFPLCWSGVDAQDLSVLQGSSSRLAISSAFVAEPVINWIALDMLYQEISLIVSLDRSLMSFFDELSVIYLLTMYWFALVHQLFRFVAFPLHLDVLSPPLMEFEV